MDRDKPIMGVVATRNCPTCGHHEIWDFKEELRAITLEDFFEMLQ